MKILIIHKGIVPAIRYGGTERDIWYQAYELNQLGHEVDFLMGKGSKNPYGNLFEWNDQEPIYKQIPEGYDMLHFHYRPNPEWLDEVRTPYVISVHGNTSPSIELDQNSIFVSANHAERHGSHCFVYNGMNWDAYPKPNFKKSDYIHFLGNAAWKVKNIKGAIEVTHRVPQLQMHVLGGFRFNFRMGVRLTFSPKIRFHGMVNDLEKGKVLNASSGLLFPVRWNEPFGLAITESMYYGNPIFATPYGSLPELITPEIGYLSNSSEELASAIKNRQEYNPKHIHEIARTKHSSKNMVNGFLALYEKVLNGGKLNKTKPRRIPGEPKLLPWN